MDSDRLSTAGLYAHTASRMRLSQFRGVAERKARQTFVHRLPIDFDRRYERRIPDSLALRASPVAENTDALRASVDPGARRRDRERAARAAAGTVTFLNRSVSFSDPERPAWEADELDELPRLWRLKLYAFEPLRWLVVGHDDPADAREEVAVLDEWVRDWCARAEVGGPNYLRTTWTPYSVSLRLLHWTRYLAWRIEGDGDDTATGARAVPPTAALARELYKNALFLRNHVERGVGGNHLIENGAALAVAGLFVGEDDWTREGVDILAHAGRTQFLDDGGHYERSPMYHVLTTTRYLTVCDLLDRTGREIPAALRETARDAVGFLRALRPPDGRLPLLNDSVHGQGLSLGACLRYARRTGVVAGDDGGTDASDAPARTRPEDGCAASGYHWLSTDAGRLLVDGGPLGPPHLPGHAHVDLLSFLLWLDGRPVVTDTGTFDYEAGERRTYARGVRGHNTVQVGDAEPVELGGRFLLGRRVEPTVRRARAGGVDLFEGRYVAPSAAAGGYAHHRSIRAGDDWWLVWDRVRDAGARPVRSRLHLHPDVAATRETDGFRLAAGVEDDRTVGWLRPLSVGGVGVTRSEYYPRFGDARTRSTLELRAEDGDDAAFGVLVTGADAHPERVDVSLGDDGSVDAVAFDGEPRGVPRATLAPAGDSDDTNDLYDFLR